MNEDLKRKIGSTVYDRIMAARMSEHERRTALHAMRTADDMVTAFVWLTDGLERLAARLVFRPSLKH